MALYKTLYESTSKVSKKTPDSVKIPRVSHLGLTYNPNDKTLTFTAGINSNTTSSTYDVMLEFSDVEPTQGLTEEEIAKGFQPKPDLETNDIKVFCNCTNYRFRFDEYNRKAGAGTGPAFPSYVRKTNRAPNNPQQLPGVCSHIIELVEYLSDRGFFS